MSEENVEIVRRGWDAYERGDLSAAFANLSPDLVTHVMQGAVGTYHGPEGLLQSLIDWAEGFDELDQKAEEFIDAGHGQVIVRVHQTARLTDSSAPVEGIFWFVTTVREGNLVRVEVWNDKDEALKAAGMSE
jgi:ketosteroid isomerase-like protein